MTSSQVKDELKVSVGEFCKDYNEYHSIKQSSLMGFKKYLQDHHEALVVQNQICPEKYQEIDQITIGLGFNQQTDFHLCDFTRTDF